jgi:hypothetical protein
VRLNLLPDVVDELSDVQWKPIGYERAVKFRKMKDEHEAQLTAQSRNIEDTMVSTAGHKASKPLTWFPSSIAGGVKLDKYYIFPRRCRQ